MDCLFVGVNCGWNLVDWCITAVVAVRGCCVDMHGLIVLSCFELGCMWFTLFLFVLIKRFGRCF